MKYFSLKRVWERSQFFGVGVGLSDDSANCFFACFGPYMMIIGPHVDTGEKKGMTEQILPPKNPEDRGTMKFREALRFWDKWVIVSLYNNRSITGKLYEVTEHEDPILRIDGGEGFYIPLSAVKSIETY